MCRFVYVEEELKSAFESFGFRDWTLLWISAKKFPLPYAYRKVMEMKAENERSGKKIGDCHMEDKYIEMEEDDSIIDMTDYTD
ncbi:MAG: hypothetical protein LUG93_18715 [Lachnospiraceae bacterium]|nr:hypothetical protein [Lachnospiraceae bacterium]